MLLDNLNKYVENIQLQSNLRELTQQLLKHTKNNYMKPKTDIWTPSR